MCNRTWATLKALQILGNSVQGLDHAQWRLTYNVICLPILTYGFQLWYMGKQKTLVKKLQTVQNEAVKLISGTFCMMPQAPLHQLLTIFPMEFRLNMLLQNSALWLYKVPNESQLLRCLEGKWHTPSLNDLPLPTPNNPHAALTLQKLAACMPANGPCIIPFPTKPVGTPDWNRRVKIIPKNSNWDYCQTTEALIHCCRAGATVNIFCEGIVSNKDHADNAQLGATAGILYQEGREYGYSEQALGTTVTQADTLLCVLHSGLDILTDYLTAHDAQAHTKAIIHLPSCFAINRVLDASPHKEQQASINHLHQIDNLLQVFPHMNITLMWLPRSIPFMGFKRAKQCTNHLHCQHCNAERTTHNQVPKRRHQTPSSERMDRSVAPATLKLPNLPPRAPRQMHNPNFLSGWPQKPRPTWPTS